MADVLSDAMLDVPTGNRADDRSRRPAAESSRHIARRARSTIADAMAAKVALVAMAALALLAAPIMSGPGTLLVSAPRVEAQTAGSQTAGASADLIVDFGDGRARFERVLIEAGASGVDLLRDAGLGVEFGSGGLVCRVGGVGCPADDCFCHCEDMDDCRYWSYHLGDPETDGGWRFADVGAEGRRLADGDIDAWVWGGGWQPITATRGLRDALAAGSVADDVTDGPRDEDSPSGFLDPGDPERLAAITAAAAWTADQRADDGGFQGFGLGATIDAVLALAAVGEDPDPVGEDGLRPSDAITAGAAEYAAGGVSAAGKLLAGAAALGLDARDVGGTDVVALLTAGLDPDGGGFGAGGTWDQAWPIIGLSAIGLDVPPAAVDTLVEATAEDGGWGFEPNAEAADADSTGLVLQALAAAGTSSDHPAVRAGLVALRALQNPDGGFAGHDGASNATSTAYAIGGLVASGHVVDGLGWSVAGTGDGSDGDPDEPRSPIDALLSFQGSDGAFAGFSGPADHGATYAALLGLSGRALPIRDGADMIAPAGAGESAEIGGDDEAVVEQSDEGAEFESSADDVSDEAAVGSSPGALSETTPMASRLGAWPLVALVALLFAGLWWVRRRA